MASAASRTLVGVGKHGIWVMVSSVYVAELLHLADLGVVVSLYWKDCDGFLTQGMALVWTRIFHGMCSRH